MRVLLTGFGPFPGVDDNPSERLVRSLGHDEPCLRGITLRRAILSTSWRFCDRWVTSDLLREPFDLAIHLGVAGRADRFRFEAVAANECDADAEDAQGEHPRSVAIVEGALATLVTRFPVDHVVATLSGRGVPVRRSEDAGRYLCNYLYYRSMHAVWSRGTASQTVLFVHIPTVRDDRGGDDEARGLHWAEHRRFIRALFEALPLVVNPSRRR